MSTIRIDDSKPFPYFPNKSSERQESAQVFFKRQAAGLKLISDEMEEENREQEELHNLQKKSFERKKKLLFDNLDLILRHREEILTTPHYANIGVPYAIRGGGLYVGPLQTARQFNIAGSMVPVNLRLATLLRIWETEQFRVDCKCGNIAFIRSFTGSPLSGGSQATAFCPQCKKEIHVGHRSFGKYYWFLQAKLSEDVEAVARRFIAKWTLAEAEHEKKVAEGKWKDPKPADEFHGDGQTCSLETMINELQLKEFDEKCG